MSKIIRDISSLSQYTDTIRKKGETIVLCQGHFNIIHPGHIRFLDFARRQGSVLITAVQGKNFLDKINKDSFFSEESRAVNVAALGMVDKVYVFSSEDIQTVISAIKPHIYVKGEEFEKRQHEIQSEIQEVVKCGGKVLFSSGDVRYTASDFFEQKEFDQNHERITKLNTITHSLGIKKKKLLNLIDSFKTSAILVIGDTIVDHYVACDALGMSSEAPVLVVRELESKSFVGGAAIVARHTASLGAACRFVSVVGKDEPADIVKKVLDDERIESRLLVDPLRPTTFKTRYMVNTQKLFRVTRLREHHINDTQAEEIIETVKSSAHRINGIIFSDFVYGVISDKILKEIIEITKKNKIKLFGDLQCSSQIGNVTKFRGFDLITPTEKEARIALSDKENGLEKIGHRLIEESNISNALITLADKGFVAYEKTIENTIRNQYFPALNANPVDIVGAGDALLASTALAMASGGSLMESAVLGSGTAFLACNKIGNIPITNVELHEWITENIM